MPRCPECDEKISANDTECPSCGEPLDVRRSTGSSVWLIVVIVAGVGGLAMLGIIAVLIALLLPAVQQAREAARRTQCKNNLKQIGLAMHNYESTYRLFPAAHLNDDEGQPRISWRVSILPFLDEAPRFNRYNSDEPWDGPQNAQLLNPLPQTYACPSNPAPAVNSCYAAMTGSDSIMGSGECVSISDVKDGLSSTLMIVEACKLNIVWMQPKDIDAATFTRVGDPNGISSFHVGGVNILMADGSVRFMSAATAPQVVQGMISHSGGEPPVMDY
ncbi:MAG: DUF1559 domain-containing protein [Planctomycetes bacterium]|nr:DUF1559 domain-containing protein [Planctomycetota bacterium]